MDGKTVAEICRECAPADVEECDDCWVNQLSLRLEACREVAETMGEGSEEERGWNEGQAALVDAILGWRKR